MKTENDKKNTEVPPPILGTWKKMYAAVLLNLIFLVIIFYIFTRAFE